MEEIIYEVLTPLSLVMLIAIIALSLFVLSKGADILVDEAVSLSVHWGISKVIIGATIVSLGTTLPEATVSVMAAIQGNPDLALGNSIGSVIANTALIIGIAALIGELPVQETIIKRQGKIQYKVGILLAIISLPFFTEGKEGNISQLAGIFLLVLLGIYIYKSIVWSKNDDYPIEVIEEESKPVMIQILNLLIGMLLVIISSKILIPSVEISALRLGVPQSVIAATLVAFGTSLPELVTAVTAVKKGHGELAVGNVVGADILNILFVIGAAAAVTPDGLNVPFNFYKLQIPTMLVILILFRVFTKGKDQKISKIEGIFLLFIYLIYLLLNYLCL